MILGLGLTIHGQGAAQEGEAAFNPASLFAAEQGVVDDLTDVTTMFQERTGASATTPSGANGPIGSLKDLSPRNNWRTAPSDAARPLSRQGVGAPNVYGEWDGTNDNLAALYTVAQPFTEIACLRLMASQVGHIIGGGASNTDVLIESLLGDCVAFAGSVLGPVSPGLVNAAVVTIQYNGASSRIALNNDSYIVGDAGVGVSGGETIGAQQGGGTNFVAMQYFRRIRIMRLLTDPEVASGRTWCGAGAGIIL